MQEDINHYEKKELELYTGLGDETIRPTNNGPIHIKSDMDENGAQVHYITLNLVANHISVEGNKVILGLK